MDDCNKRFWDTFEQMQEDFDRFFDHYARAKRPTVVGYRTVWSPPCNIYDAGNALRVLVEIAGVSRDSLDLSIEEERFDIARKSFALPGQFGRKLCANGNSIGRFRTGSTFILPGRCRSSASLVSRWISADRITENS